MVTLQDIIAEMRLAASAHEQWAMSWEASAPEAASCTAFASQLKVWADALMALTGADVVENDDTCASTHTLRCTLARGHDGKHAAFRTRVSWTGDVDATARLRELEEGDAFLHPVSQVYFRAGLLACREYMARFVEAESPSIADSIRANWWPSLGPDFGPPRKLAFAEVTDGEYGTPAFRCKTADEVSPTLEALPVALGFLLSMQPGSNPTECSPLRSTPQEGTTDDLTRIGELAVQPSPQHAAADREDS